MQRNWIITNNAKAEVYAFLIRHHVSFEPSGCYDRHTCIAAWNLSYQQAILIENFITSHEYGYKRKTVVLELQKVTAITDRFDCDVMRDIYDEIESEYSSLLPDSAEASASSGDLPVSKAV